jgi:hypothetical protein
MRCVEQADGSGDLVFEVRKTRVGVLRPVGFLAIERVREVETLVREILATARVPGLSGASAEATGPGTEPTDKRRTYSLSASSRALLILFSVVFSFTTLLIATGVIVVPLVLVMGILPPAAAGRAFSAQYFGGVIFLAAFGFLTHRLLSIPVEITIDSGDRAVSFRGWFRTRTIPAAEILSVRTGGLEDPNGFQAVVRHKGGKLMLINRFSDFRDFLIRLRALNPSVEIGGF